MRYISNTLAASFAVTAALVVVLGIAVTGKFRSSQEPASDRRTVIRLPEPGRDAVLAEMRTMLKSVNGVLNGAVHGDVARMREAARASGLAAAVDLQPEMRQRLPMAFLSLGEGTHAAFDSIDAVLVKWPGRDSALVRLARLTGACVACHEAYRIEIE
ncbi:MAG TPA: hypothetical protein VK864_18525 [Longimicrobiales bacterium]|nr:hypothetical protein [Longimicrobiales bacterium]